VVSTNKKAETHERIVAGAAKALRKKGYDGVSVAELMKDAGLTHGGFYAHFESREALVVEALERASAESLESLEKMADLSELVEQYLSTAHQEAPEAGCALAALGTETRRQPDEVRAIATRGAKSLTTLVERHLPETERETRRDEARVIVSALVGAMVIARAVDSPELAKAFRSAVKRFATRR
jgi:TetR/AcrR family transcriptional repressor of nem operon